MSLKHETAAITGASSGIGKAYAERLAARGYDLLLVARRGDLLKELAESLQAKHGVSVRAVAADLTVEADLARVANLLESDPTVTLLINNAGTASLASSLEMTRRAREAMTSLNVAALVRLTFAVLPRFQAKDTGTLINIGSTLGFHSLAFSTIYSATKAYVHMFTRGLQTELDDTAIRIQLVLPAATATDPWEISGLPLSALDPTHIMTVSACVAASLAGLDAGETVTMPSIEDESLLDVFDAARYALLGASRGGTPAHRYTMRSETANSAVK